MVTAKLVVTVRLVTRTPIAPTTIRICHESMWWEGVRKCSPLMGYYEYKGSTVVLGKGVEKCGAGGGGGGWVDGIMWRGWNM